MSSRTPLKERRTTLKTGTSADPIPTVEEAKRRLAAAAGRHQPWLNLTPEFKQAMATAEEEGGGRLVGPAVYEPPKHKN